MILRDKMFYLKGQLEALRYPFLGCESDPAAGQAYYDLVDSVANQFDEIIKEVIVFWHV